MSVSDQDAPHVSMSPLVCSLITYVCEFKRVGSRIVRGGVEDSIIQMGQSDNSMGLEWTGIHSHASKTTGLK